jgi:hypothetical protein
MLVERRSDRRLPPEMNLILIAIGVLIIAGLLLLGQYAIQIELKIRRDELDYKAACSALAPECGE